MNGAIRLRSTVEQVYKIMYKLESTMYSVFRDKCKEIQEIFLGSKQVKKTYKGKSTNVQDIQQKVGTLF